MAKQYEIIRIEKQVVQIFDNCQEFIKKELGEQDKIIVDKRLKRPIVFKFIALITNENNMREHIYLVRQLLKEK